MKRPPAPALPASLRAINPRLAAPAVARRRAGAVAHARGDAFEDVLAPHHDAARAEGIADVRKVGAPVIVGRKGKPLRWAGVGPADYVGTLRGGRSLVVEAKSTATRLSLADIPEHQRAHLDACAALAGLALAAPLAAPSQPLGAGLRPYRRELSPAEALRCRCAALLAEAIDGSGPTERAVAAAARAAHRDLGRVHVFAATEAARARAVDLRLRLAVEALPEADRVPVCVAVVRALLDDAPDVMLPLDRAVRVAAEWRGYELTAAHEAAALAIVAREVGP